MMRALLLGLVLLGAGCGSDEDPCAKTCPCPGLCGCTSDGWVCLADPHPDLPATPRDMSPAPAD